ncbi:MAG: phosphoesterase [Candidatus Magnetoglobus multicellularis str. Araruama]|uniref:Phosphoesterase n=1 Tax=Candidatus Magnetoglobus multicellularis str. Araruama TaxID=890399 RepID=A0A1V1PC54_9BACT|nr:MAG: phosphoesterase [Candidatus Magnetoglobus multicellularis str. Araruama]
MKQWIGIGDIHNNVSHLDHFPTLEKADGVIIHGDITNRGDFSQAALMITRIASKNPRVYAQAGNMDGMAIQDYLDQKNMTIHRKGFELSEGIGIMGVGMSTPTPFQTPGEFPEDQLNEWLEETWKSISHMPHTIVVTHDPPYGTRLDITSGNHVGSRSVLSFIEKYQPDILLCGHIHESKGKDTIGRTRAVNPGDFASGGYALIQYQNDTLDIHFKQLNGSIL